MWINAGNPTLDQATDRIPWAHYMANSVIVVTPAGGGFVGVDLTVNRMEGNFTWDGTDSLANGTSSFRIPQGMGGLYSLSMCGSWPASGTTQSSRFLVITTTRGAIWSHAANRVTNPDVFRQACAGIIELKDGDLVIPRAYSTGAANVNFWFGDETNGKFYGMYIARIGPSKNLISNHTDAPNTIL